MPIIAKNFILTGDATQPSPVVELQNIAKPESKVEEKPSVIRDVSEPIPDTGVIVNGKVKKISKKSASAYLLDMLTLDD